MTRASVVIIGGGFSGALLALHLLADADGPDIALIERSGAFGLGAAYATRNPQHLLNTRAGNMSAFPDRPDHFLRWVQGREAGRTIRRPDFATRATYGAYLRDLLAEGLDGAAGRLSLVADEAVSLAPRGGRWAVGLVGGGERLADTAVLALGNLPPCAPEVSDPGVLTSPRYVSESWREDLAERVGDDEPVFLLGTGLTMIDVAVALGARGRRGPVFALSRRGLIPCAHVVDPTPKQDPPPVSRSLAASLRTLRRLSGEATDWRTVFDGLRPVTAALWAELPAAERARFLRHARPYWDVHRHRLAPPVAARVEGLRASGLLRVAAGRLVDIRRDGEGFSVEWRPRGERLEQVFAAAWIVNCVGPRMDAAGAGEPILRSLLEGGLARCDPHGLGLEVDADSRVIAASGRIAPGLFAVGPLTRGAFWESTAVPDLRNQAAEVARRVLALGRAPDGLDPPPGRG